MEEIFKLVNGLTYEDDIPKEAIDLAEKEGCLIVVGASDDIACVYGAKCYLSDEVELDCYEDTDFSKYNDKSVRDEAFQLGLKVSTSNQNGALFYFTVNENIEHINFTIFEDESKEDIYCIGLIIKLPKYFKVAG